MEKEKEKKDENVSPALIPTSKVSMMCKNKKRKATKIDSQGKKGGKKKTETIVWSRPRRINAEKQISTFWLTVEFRITKFPATMMMIISQTYGKQQREGGGGGATNSNVLSIRLLLLPKFLGLLTAELALLHDYFNKRLMNTLAHTLGRSADKDATVDRVDDGPDKIGLRKDLFLHVAARADTGLDDAADFVFMLPPFARVQLIQKRVSNTLDNPEPDY